MATTSSGTRYAIDAVTALRLVEEAPGAGARHRLVGPAVLRSDVMSRLFRQVREGQLQDREARARLEALAGLKIRLLGDRVSRATAWTLATRLGWEEIGTAEYLAVATLQADVLVAGDERIAAAADGIIPLGDVDDLLR